MASPANLKEIVHAQMVAAMKAGNKNRTQVVRMVLSEIKAQEADKPDADPLLAVAAYAKKLKKTQAEMERLQQPERAKALADELRIIDEFLPKPLDDAELGALVERTIQELGATVKDIGKVTGAVMKAAGPMAEAGKVRALILSKLS